VWGGVGGENLQADSPLGAEPNKGLDPRTHEITTRAEIKSQSLNRLSHPGVPKVDTFEMNMKIKIVGRKVEVINKKQVKQKWN